jgi:hypothetical protein
MNNENMILQKKSKEKVLRFSFIDNNIFIINSNKELTVNESIINEGQFSFFGTYRNLQIVFDQENFSSLMYNINGDLVEQIKEYALRNIFTFSNTNSLVGGNDGTDIFYGIYNFSDKSLLKRFNHLGLNGVSFVINDILFLSQNNEKFGVFTFDNVCVWEVYFKDLFNEYEPIGAGRTNILKTETDLYIELDKTYRININTGKLQKTYEQKYTNCEGEFLYGLQFLSMKKFELAILNTKTDVVEIIDISNEFNRLKIYPDNKITVSNKLIYFSQNMGDNIAKVGILNPENGNVLWKYDFEKRNGMIGTIKINQNKIYVHTQDKKLHIFERSTTANNGYN